MKGQAFAIALVMACGIAVFIMSLTTHGSLKSAQDAYYEHYRFADIFAHLKRAPNALGARISEIPGVSRVETRVVADVTLDVVGMSEPVTGRLISLPENPGGGLNRLHLRSGRHIEPGRKGEVIASEPFVEAHRLKPGDRVQAVINGHLDTLKIVGVAISPEFIYQIRPGDIFPDDKRFGVFWMDYEELATAYNLENAFNDLSLTLMPGASQPEIIRQIDRLTRDYGGLGAYGREDQLSNRLISDEMRNLHTMSFIDPTIFLAVAAFIINVVLTRLINTQREQIAMLKAFGYGRFEIGFHYLKFVLVISVAALLLGTAVGAWLGKGLTGLYVQYFRFPAFSYHLDLRIVSVSFLASCAAAVLGIAGAVIRAMHLPPAEAMRPEPPGIYKPTILERMGFQRLFSPPMRMILRQLERRPSRAILSCLGIALAGSLLVLANFIGNTVNYLVDFQFYISQRQDMTLTLVEPKSTSALYEISHLPGVIRAEPFRSVPVRLRFGHSSRRTAIMGLGPHRELFRLINADEKAVQLPMQGLLLSAKLAELIGAKLGDTLTVEVMEGSRPIREAVVSGLISDFSGISAYMDIRALNRMMQEGETISGAFVTADSDRLPAIYRALKETPGIGGISLKEAALLSFQDTMEKNLLTMKFFYVLFACVIAFGVVYNSIQVSFSERNRELATLRVIGFTRREVAFILLGEAAALTAIAIPLGLLFGYWLSAFVVYAMQTEVVRLPLVIASSTYAFAAVTLTSATIVSSLGIRRKLDRLDLVSVLKARD